MSVLFATHPAYLEHLTGPGHPERPSRLQAVIAGAYGAGLADALIPLEPVAAKRDDLARVHPEWYLDRLESMAAAGGGWIDADTRLSTHSATAAHLAAGAGLTAVEALREGKGDAAFCAVRPPGHHATPTDSMGFCLVSNVAVVAASLADAGSGCGSSTTTPTTATAPRRRSSRTPVCCSSASTSGRCTRARGG